MDSATPSPLRRVMRATEYFTLAFGCIIGVGWLVVIDEWLQAGGPLGAMLAFLACGLALVPIALVYGRLAGRMPEAASEIAYTAAVFPPVVSFLTGWSMTFAALIVCPYEAVAIGRLVSYVIPQLNTLTLYQFGEYPVYLPHLVLGFVLTLAVGSSATSGVRRAMNRVSACRLVIHRPPTLTASSRWRPPPGRLEPLTIHLNKVLGLVGLPSRNDGISRAASAWPIQSSPAKSIGKLIWSSS